jgi:hypothetical protein
MKQNNSDEVLLNSSSKSIAINETPKSNKSPLPDSPNDLPATQRKEGRRPSQTKVSPNDLPATQMKEGRHLSQTKGHYPTVLMTYLPHR